MIRFKRSVLLLMAVFSVVNLFPQEVFYPLEKQAIYRFLDELAGSGIINFNSTVKPYSRKAIANLLLEATEKKNLLSARQKKELEFYLRDFGKELTEYGEKGKRKDLFFYHDSVFTITFNPILGGEVFYNPSGYARNWRNGIEAFSSIGKLGIWATFYDNHENPLLSSPEFLLKRPGGHIKDGTDWSVMKAGISWDWKWGSIALVNDILSWGNGYNGANIFSGNTPPFFQLKINIKPVKWIEFNYIHGSLNSMVVDSTRSYYVKNSYGTDYREVYHRKYLAANLFTIQPIEKLNISTGNSIIYSDYGFNPVFLIPVLFFKSVDHSQNSGIDNMNSQMFLDVSFRRIKNLHIYGTLFIDELSVSRFFKNDEWNFFSYKAGASVYNLPFQNLQIIAEFTYTYPLTFQHYVPTLTFETNRYNLGHYLKDNSREWYFSIVYHPTRASEIRFWYCDAVRGPDYTHLGTPRVGNPPLSSIEWQNTSAGICADFQIINDLFFRTSIVRSRIQGATSLYPSFLSGNKTTFNIGIGAGF